VPLFSGCEDPKYVHVSQQYNAQQCVLPASNQVSVWSRMRTTQAFYAFVEVAERRQVRFTAHDKNMQPTRCMKSCNRVATFKT